MFTRTAHLKCYSILQNKLQKLLKTAQDQYSLETLAISLSELDERSMNDELSGQRIGAAQRTAAFLFFLLFIDPDYMQDLALFSTSHAPRFLLRHPTATRRGRHCRVTKPCHTHTCARREGSAALTSLHAEDRHTHAHTQQKE
jgi:hypothetical protein